MHQAAPKIQSVMASYTEMTLGVLVEVTAHAWCPTAAQCWTPTPPVASTRQERKCLKTEQQAGSKLSQERTSMLIFRLTPHKGGPQDDQRYKKARLSLA